MPSILVDSRKNFKDENSDNNYKILRFTYAALIS